MRSQYSYLPGHGRSGAVYAKLKKYHSSTNGKISRICMTRYSTDQLTKSTIHYSDTVLCTGKAKGAEMWGDHWI
jgi:hypothetical protein